MDYHALEGSQITEPHRLMMAAAFIAGFLKGRCGLSLAFARAVDLPNLLRTRRI